MCKLFFIFSFLFLSVLDAHAEVESVASGKAGSDYSSLQDTVLSLESLRDMLDTTLTIIKSCGDSNQLFDGTAGCLPALTEEDPEIQNHSRNNTGGDIGVSCTARDEALVYNGSTWVCKTMAP